MKLDKDVLFSLLSSPTFDYRKENIMAICPYCGVGEFGVSLSDNHVFNCFRKSKCGETGNIYKLLKKLDRLDLLGNNGVESIKYDERLENIIERKIEQKLDLDLETIEPPLGWKRVYSNFYLENRDFDSFEKYEVGTTKLDRKFKDHVITLIRERGDIKAYVARIAKTKEEIRQIELKLGRKIPRYQNSSTDFLKLLGGYDEINSNTTTVILVEGLYGKENVDRILQLDSQEIVKCCFTFGAKLSDEQVFKLQLKGVKHIILFFDIDVIHKIKQYSLDYLNEFETVKIIYSKYKNKDGSDKDPSDLNEKEMFETYNNQIDPIKFYFDKVRILNLK